MNDYSDIGVQVVYGIKNTFDAIPFAYIFALFHDVVLVLDIGLVAVLIFVLTQLQQYRPVFYQNPRDALKGEKRIPTLRDAGIAKRWKSIREKAEAAPPQSLTLGIIEADSFVDDILKRMGIAGEHMADRLERIDTGDLQTLDLLWTAHRARNNLVHSPGYVMSEFDARKYMKDYEAFLRELGVLE